MKITIYGDIIESKVVCGDIEYTELFDPNGFIGKYNNQSDLIITLQIKVSKKGNFVALVKDIKIA